MTQAYFLKLSKNLWVLSARVFLCDNKYNGSRWGDIVQTVSLKQWYIYVVDAFCTIYTNKRFGQEKPPWNSTFAIFFFCLLAMEFEQRKALRQTSKIGCKYSLIARINIQQYHSTKYEHVHILDNHIHTW